MKRIGILTAGGDTPALNATIHGAVVRSNQLRIEIYGFIKGFNCFFNPRVPHVHLNPLFQGIPELDPTKGGTLIGSSRDYVDANNREECDLLTERLQKLGIEGLIAIGGDGTVLGDCLCSHGTDVKAGGSPKASGVFPKFLPTAPLSELGSQPVNP